MVFGMVLKIAPLFSLLIAGLAYGLLAAIPIYLLIRVACFWAQLQRKEQTMSRQRAVKEAFGFLLGGISLATLDPVWFKLEITLISVLALAAWIVSGRPLLADIEPFPPASVIGETAAGVMKNIFLFGLAGVPVINLWLALQFSETAWLLFRTLGFFVWIAGFAMLGTWLAAKKAEAS